MVDLGNRRLTATSVLICFSYRREEVEELCQITFIIPQSMRAHISFIAQMIEELSEKLIHYVDTRSRIKRHRPLRLIVDQFRVNSCDFVERSRSHLGRGFTCSNPP